ncbi:MAG: nickel pincer cofactor biosynthesis protein LarB [Planctomycetaceae bacterium]|nr:nickel pincer cofactor biosynthesis protein LarB [Planctomycetaceae bacterium]
MNENVLKQLLQAVQSGQTGIEAAIEALRHLPFEAGAEHTIDHHRAIRCGFPEVIFCPGKTLEHVRAIFAKLAAMGTNVLATRATPEQFAAVAAEHPAAEFHQAARAITLRQEAVPAAAGRVAVVSAGTGDIPVAEEARVTAEIMNQSVSRHYDVGVAGLHRLLAHRRSLAEADAIVVVAGMEGALPSVVGGLVSAPVIGVPTSIGYGASFGGLTALLSMLTSCASGVSTVNIDNGFGGGYIAATIARNVAAARGHNHERNRADQ